MSNRGAADSERADVIKRQTTETRFRELLESAPDAVVLVGVQGKINLVNRRTEELFGYEPGELIEREVEMLVPDRFRAGHLAHRAGYIADPQTREMGAGLELYGRRRDGSEFPVEISLSPMQAEGDEMVIAIVRDVSERRGAEREHMELTHEQSALRRVATLVARAVPAQELFAAVTEEVARLLDVDHAHLGRYQSDNTVTILADSSSAGDPFPVGGRWSLMGENLSRTVAQTGRPARIDDYSGASGPLAAASAERGIRSGVGTPIVVEGRLWGVMVVGSMKEQPLPADTEARLAAFTELVATAIANVDSRVGIARLAEEQAALRRVATLVARGVPAHEVFDAVASETKRILEFDTATLLRLEPDGSVTVAASVATLPLLTAVGDRRAPLAGGPVDRALRTGRPARIDDFEGEPGSPGDELNTLGYGGAAAAPIFVEGRLWGVLRAAWSKERSVSPGSEDRLLQFSELIATALANAEAREELRRVAEEQAALRRVATLVARGEPPSAVFAAVAAEAGRVMSVAGVALVGRYDLAEESIEFVGAWSPEGEPGFVGTRVALGGRNVATLVFERNEPARVDRIPPDDTPATALARNWARSSAGAPIDVDGRLWGVVTVGATHEDELPPGTEYRLAQFTELVASAISNAQARADLGRVADEQAALRRVATLVAEAAPPSAVFDSVAEEVGRLLAVDAAAVRRYLPDDTAEILAQWSRGGEFIPVGLRAQPVPGTVTATVRETMRPARVDRYADDAGEAAREIGIRSSVGVPITVEGELWGLIAVVSTGEEPPPPGTEDRLAGFTELVATAIANAQAREELRTIADEQTALRRVALLVAAGAPPADVFAAVSEEVGHLLSVDGAFVVRYESDDAVTVLAGRTTADSPLPTGLRTPIIAPSLGSVVRDTERPARIDHYADHPVARQYGIRFSAAAPITVQGRLWGYIGVTSSREEPPPGTELRLAAFTEIAATAIANAESRAEVMASRARIVTAADEERGRVVRDLHDGAEQHLVHAVVTLKLARGALTKSDPDAGKLLDDALQQAEEANLELRELARGIVPAALTRGGLRAGAEAVVSRMSVPVRVDVTDERFPADVESTAYFVVSEALTNVTKHAHASSAQVTARVEGALLRVEIVDDGVGGLRRTGISGLTGLEDRVSALHGSLLSREPCRPGDARARSSAPSRQRLRARRFAQVGEDREHPAVFGLGWVELERLEDARDMLLHSRLADQERLGDAPVGLAFRHRLEHFSVPCAEPFDRPVALAAAQHTRDDLGVERGAASSDARDRIDEGLNVTDALLQQVANPIGSIADELERIALVIELREQQHAGTRMLTAYLNGRP